MCKERVTISTHNRYQKGKLIMKIIRAELSESKDDKFYICRCNNRLTVTRFGLKFDIELNEDDIFQTQTILDYANGKIDDKSIFDHAKEKFNESFNEALDEFVKRMVSRE